MLKIKVTTPFPEYPFSRQTPQTSACWNESQFYINDDTIDCDYWVVYENLLKTESAYCPKNNTILITGEPPCIKKYESDFINQFGKIITSHETLNHPNLLLRQQALPWMIGRRFTHSTKSWIPGFTKDYDSLLDFGKVEKSKLLSTIISSKSVTAGHRERQNFINKLKMSFEDTLNVYGSGVSEIEDKWDAISPYKYHIVLENCSIPNYWTEKLSDCFLSEAFPFYWGCKNLHDYFPKGSFKYIDINNPNEALNTIKKTIEKNTFENAQFELKEAKKLVLNNHNFFSLVSDMVEEKKRKKEMITLFPQTKSFSITSKIKIHAKKIVKTLFN